MCPFRNVPERYFYRSQPEQVAQMIGAAHSEKKFSTHTIDKKTMPTSK